MKTTGDLLGRMPEVPSCAADLYAGFWEIDREGMTGSPTMAGMRAVLDELGVSDRLLRRRIRQLWAQMESKRKAKAEDLKGPRETADSGAASHKARRGAG